MMSVATSPELIRFDFEEVPEVKAEDLQITFDQILKARRGRRLSFGAYVLRKAGSSGLKACVDFLQKNLRPDQSVSIDSFFGHERPSIHADPGGRNSVTIHHTEKEQAEAAVLVGSRILVPHILSEAMPWGKEIDYLFDNKQIGSDVLSTPSRALLTTVGEDDILIFDSSQPHTFRSSSPERVSTAYYAGSAPTSQIHVI